MNANASVESELLDLSRQLLAAVAAGETAHGLLVRAGFAVAAQVFIEFILFLQHQLWRFELHRLLYKRLQN